MLSAKRLSPLSACKIQTNFIRNGLKSTGISEGHINKPYLLNYENLCRSFSVLHHSTNKSHNLQLRTVHAEYKAACALLKRSNLPSLISIFSNNSHIRGIHTTPTNFNQPDDKNKDKKDDKNDEFPSLLMKAAFWMFTTCILIIMSSVLVPADNTQNELIRYVSWNEFVYSMLAKGEVEELIVRPDMEVVTIILYEGAVIKGKRVTHRAFHMNVGDIHRFEEKLRATEKSLGVKEGVRVIYDRNGSVAGKIITTLLIGAVILSFLYSTKSMKMNINLGGFSQLGRAKFTLVDSMTSKKGIKFDDVAGLHEAKVELLEFIEYLKNPERFKSLGAKVPKGALLLGPPGCGKTLLAKAVATEANVPFLSMNGSEFIEMIGGLGAARVRDLFKEAGSRAPAIIYIDELDAVGRARSSGASSYGPGGGEGEQTLNQLLVEMDGMKSREGVIVLASTNRAEVLDKALLRPGRFDRHILIDLPNLQEREEIFKSHLRHIVLEDLPPMYVKRLASLTPGFSGADIANVCNEAALHAAREMQSVVKRSNFDYAIEKVIGGTEKRSHAMSPATRKIVAYHECGHALVGWLLEHTFGLLRISIVPRTNNMLGVTQHREVEKKLFSTEELFDIMCMTLGGRAAEAIIFNSVTSGGQDDLEKVTKMAYAQVKTYGMSPRIGLISFPVREEQGRSPFSKALKNQMDIEVRSIISRAYFRTEGLLREHESKLKLLAEELLKKETLSYREVEALIGPPTNPGKKLLDSVEIEQTLKGLESSDESAPIGAPSANKDAKDSTSPVP